MYQDVTMLQMPHYSVSRLHLIFLKYTCSATNSYFQLYVLLQYMSFIKGSVIQQQQKNPFLKLKINLHVIYQVNLISIDAVIKF